MNKLMSKVNLMLTWQAKENKVKQKSTILWKPCKVESIVRQNIAVNPYYIAGEIIQVSKNSISK